MKLQLVLVAAVAGSLAGPVAATNTDWGTHKMVEVGVSLTPVGSFEDNWSFTLPASTSLASTTVANNLGSILNLSGGMVQLFMESGTTDTQIGSYTFNGTTGSTAHSFASLVPGDYFYRVTGTGTGSQGGFYALTSTISAIPEPTSAAMLLAGLGVAGLLLYRRRSDES
jgi:hypothetical protein